MKMQAYYIRNVIMTLKEKSGWSHVGKATIELICVFERESEVL